MPKLRPYLVVLTLLATALAPLAGSAFTIPSLGSSAALAAPSLAPTAQDDDNDNDDDDGDNNNANDNDDTDNANDNVDNANDNDDTDNANDNADNANDNDDGNNNNNNDNDGNDDNGNGNDNGNDVDDGDDNDNNADVIPVSPESSAPAPAPAPAAECSTPGQEMTFASSDGRVQLKVFSSLTQSVRFSIRLPIDAASVPPAPGPVVGGLLFQLIAESCDGTPIATLPAEVNLGVHYADADAAGLNEQNFKLARLDTSANQWRDAAKQATDPPANFTSATITEMGIYVLTQR